MNMHRTEKFKYSPQKRFLTLSVVRVVRVVRRVSGDLRLKILPGMIPLLLSASLFICTGDLSASPGVQSLLIASSQGQLFQRQPKEDPFKPATESIDRLMQEKKQQAREHLRQAREGLARGNLKVAMFHCKRVVALEVTFSSGEDNPEKLLADIDQFRKWTAGNAAANAERPLPGVFSEPNTVAIPARPEVRPATATLKADAVPGKQTLYEPQNDATFNRSATASENDSLFTPPTVGSQSPLPNTTLPSSRVNGLRTNDLQMTPTRTSSSLLATPRGSADRSPGTIVLTPESKSKEPALTSQEKQSKKFLEETGQAEERLRQQVMAEVARQSRKALDLRADDPVGAIGAMQKTRAMIEESSLSREDKKVLLGRVDRLLAEMEKYVQRHRTEIELDASNQQVLDDLARNRDYRVEVDQRLATLVDEYNKLRNEQRFYEAEVKAKQARTLAPDEPVVTQMFEEIRFYRRVMNNQELREEKDEAVWATLNAVEFAGVPFGDDRNPIQFIDQGDWKKLSERRAQFSGDQDRKRHPAELEIEKKLNTPVSLKFKDAPLSEVTEHIGKVGDINIYVDPEGLAEEGVHSSTPVTIDLSQEISLKSALNLILSPLHLDYVIQNEVLKITSEQLRDRNVYSKTYNVADLVLPIPNAPEHSQLGLPASLARGYERTNKNLAGANGFRPSQMSVSTDVGVPGLTSSGEVPKTTLAQTSGNYARTGQGGGAGQADFEQLITLITTTIQPDTWDELGGEGRVAEFETNMSLVVSQTQEVHEEIADLLEQLRRLQDLQVTIEVRFINLRDNFFEQIGIDFDLNIDSNVSDNNLPNNDSGRSTTIGLGFDNGGNPTNQRAAPANPITNLVNGANDIQIRQGSFAAVQPGFGGYAANTATTMGIAILSDLEAYFFVRAVQGDKRTNILQSPKVTLFNGQAASVSDQIQQPFVTSVTPVVGDFAAAQAPVIVVLAEGTSLSVQAVVSPDRRYVRLTLVPFFSEIRDVNEFTFEGSSTSTEDRTDSNEETAAGGTANSSSNNSRNFTQGTTIQLPTFAFTTVTTTVSVPDGGTVLLGGVKRLDEQRDEIGTPFLSKLPYVSRLFKNVAIGRQTESLMLMVTPRIIIQQEEEEIRGIAPP
jgi:general secretion pathway protein D